MNHKTGGGAATGEDRLRCLRWSPYVQLNSPERHYITMKDWRYKTRLRQTSSTNVLDQGFATWRSISTDLIYKCGLCIS